MRRLLSLFMGFVVYALPVVAQPANWSLDSRPSAGIGSADGDPNYMFSLVMAAMKTADGRILVADRDGTIRVYDATGKYLQSIGGQGEGPGEFRHLRTMFSTAETPSLRQMRDSAASRSSIRAVLSPDPSRIR